MQNQYVLGRKKKNSHEWRKDVGQNFRDMSEPIQVLKTTCHCLRWMIVCYERADIVALGSYLGHF